MIYLINRHAKYDTHAGFQKKREIPEKNKEFLCLLIPLGKMLKQKE